jgi:drug/metabolite transporter (DMT)-like permease
MKPTHLTWLVLLNVAWAASYSAFKVFPSEMSPGDIVTVRYLLAAALALLVWPWLPGPSPLGRDLALVACMGVLVFCAAPRLQVWGVTLGRAGDSSVLVALEPLVTTMAAAMFLGESIPVRRWIGFSLGIVGVALLNRIWRPDFQVAGLGANMVFIASFLCEVAYSVMGKPIFPRAGILRILAAALIAGSIVNVAFNGPGALRAIRHMPGEAWLAMGHLVVVCTLIGYSVWYVVIRDADVNLVVTTVFIQPLAGVLIAAIWLGDPLHWGQVWGGLAIVSGIIIALTPRQSQPQSRLSTL